MRYQPDLRSSRGSRTMVLALLALSAFIAFLIQSAIGFGGVIVTLALSGNVYSLAVLVPVAICLDLLQGLTILRRHHRGIEYRTLAVGMLPLLVAGLPIGLLLATRASEAALRVAVGSVIVVLALLELVMLARRNTARARLAWPAESMVLLGGGVVHGLFGGGGPMVVYAAGRRIPDKHAFRSTLAALWVLLDVLLLVGFALTGRLTAEVARLAALLLLPLALGIAAGEVIHARVSAPVFRVLVYVMLLVAGSLLVVNA